MADKRNWREITLNNDSDVWDRENPIEGKLLKTETNVGPNSSTMYTIKTEDGEVKVWGSTVLDDKLASLDPGSYVKIEYEGKQKSQRGTEYHSYKVYVDDDQLPEAPVEEEIDLNDIPFGND